MNYPNTLCVNNIRDIFIKGIVVNPEKKEAITLQPLGEHLLDAEDIDVVCLWLLAR